MLGEAKLVSLRTHIVRVLREGGNVCNLLGSALASWLETLLSCTVVCQPCRSSSVRTHAHPCFKIYLSSGPPALSHTQRRSRVVDRHRRHRHRTVAWRERAATENRHDSTNVSRRKGAHSILHIPFFHVNWPALATCIVCTLLLVRVPRTRRPVSFSVSLFSQTLIEKRAARAD